MLKYNLYIRTPIHEWDNNILPVLLYFSPVDQLYGDKDQDQ